MKIRCNQPTTEDPDGKKCGVLLGVVEDGILRYTDEVRAIAKRRGSRHGDAWTGSFRDAFEGQKELKTFDPERSSDIHLLRRYFAREIVLADVSYVLLVCECQEFLYGPHLQEHLIGVRTSSILARGSAKRVSVDRLERVDPMPVLGDFQFGTEDNPVMADAWTLRRRELARMHRAQGATDLRVAANAQNPKFWKKST